MTFTQKIKEISYRFLMWIGKSKAKKMTRKSTTSEMAPQRNFFSLTAKSNAGQPVDFSIYKGKKILLVNTASECGYTPQYEELQQLYEGKKDKLVILGFPSNEFGGQEQGTDENIAAFCEENYRVTFPLFQKSLLLKGAGQNSVFRWLTSEDQNGWNDQEPVWNFNKYLINENGYLTHYFPSAASPLGPEITRALSE